MHDAYLSLQTRIWKMNPTKEVLTPMRVVSVDAWNFSSPLFCILQFNKQQNRYTLQCTKKTKTDLKSLIFTTRQPHKGV